MMQAKEVRQAIGTVRSVWVSIEVTGDRFVPILTSKKAARDLLKGLAGDAPVRAEVTNSVLVIGRRGY